MTTADLTLEGKWESIRRPRWTPLHPEWEVRMLRKGESLRPGDFLLSSMRDGEALYVFTEGETADETGRLFRYMTDSIVPCEVGLSDIVEWLEHQQRDKYHAARLTLRELASSYSDATGPDRARIYGNIIAYMDDNDFGCLVSFCEDSGMVDFIEREDGE